MAGEKIRIRFWHDGEAEESTRLHTGPIPNDARVQQAFTPMTKLDIAALNAVAGGV